MILKKDLIWQHKSRPFCNKKGRMQLKYVLALPIGVVIDSAKLLSGIVLPFVSDETGTYVYGINIPKGDTDCVIVTLKVKSACKVSCPMSVMSQWQGQGGVKCSKPDCKYYDCITCKELRECTGEVKYTVYKPKLKSIPNVIDQNTFELPEGADAETFAFYANGVLLTDPIDYDIVGGVITTVKNWGTESDPCNVVFKYNCKEDYYREDGCHVEIRPGKAPYVGAIQQSVFYIPPQDGEILDDICFFANGLLIDKYTATKELNGSIKIETDDSWGTTSDPCNVLITYSKEVTVCKDPCEDEEDCD